MEKLLLFINSLYLGLGAFFSFYVAPTLFRVLEKSQAGKVVEKVFPVYFSVGLVVSLLTLILGFRYGKFLLLLALLNSLLHGVHLFYVLPTASRLKEVDYQAFMTWHGISMGINLLSLLITLVLCVYLIKR